MIRSDIRGKTGRNRTGNRFSRLRRLLLAAVLMAVTSPAAASADLAFKPAVDVPVGDFPQDVASADLNGDGYNDLAYQQFLASLPAYAKDARMPGWYRDFTGFVLTEPRLEQENDGSYSSWIYGRGLNDLLYSEYIDYPPGQPQTRKNAVAETVAKELVNENIGPGAGVDAGGYTRVRAGLTIEPDDGAGATWKADRSRKLLGDVLQEVGDAGPGDYMIVQIGDAAFEFQWRSPHWGQDKRCLLYTSPSPRDRTRSRMPSSA